ncbi:sensory histidine kinase AtoS [Escherichia coli]|nr:sensory histidine kinase AtoS [Escherichia coli]
MHYMKWIYPRRLRNQMILMAILMVIVPTLTIGYIVETEGRSAVLSEKEKKLSAVVNLLNQALGDRYDLYIDLPREERIRALNAELAPHYRKYHSRLPWHRCWLLQQNAGCDNHLRAFSAISE